MIKYVLCPGTVASQVDLDTHYISATQLAKLYGVRLTECIVRPTATSTDYLEWTPPEGAILLRPRYNGDYALPTEED